VLAAVTVSLLPTVFLSSARADPGADMALVAGSAVQYQRGEDAVSRPRFQPVSRRNYAAIPGHFFNGNALYFEHIRPTELRLDPSVEIRAAQYQGTEPRADERRLMLRIGLGLGAVYIVFLTGWIWGTRLRSRPPRH
jgi:hypothetical protein